MKNFFEINRALAAEKKFFSLVLATVVATATAFAAVQTVTNNDVTCGTNVTITAEPAIGHHFVQWSDGVKLATRTLENVTGDIELTATFAIDTFTITFMAHGQVYATQRVTYGSTPAVPAGTPESYQTDEYTYTFSNWPAFAAATEDATYTAVYSSATRYYTITFLNYNDDVLDTQNLPWNATVTYGGETPAKPSSNEYTYTFSGWSPAIANVSGNATYRAQFTEATRYYTITFLNYNNDVLDTQSLPWNAAVTYGGATPTKPADSEHSYTFTGWDPAIANVSGDATYTAQFNAIARQYTITVAHEEGGEAAVIGDDTVNYNGTVTIKAEPNACYEFDKWLEDNSTEAEREVTVTGDATYTATFKVKHHSVTIKSNDGGQGTVRFVTQ